MNSKQKASPATVAALIGATCLAVGFAAWSITRAMKPAAPPPGARSPAAQTLPPAPLELAGPAPEDGVQIRRVALGEASLAPSADPFAPLPEPPRAAALSVSLPPLGPPLRGGSRPPMLPAMTTWPGGPAGIPPAQPLPALPSVTRSTPTPAAPPPPKPELIGTLLGPRPSAVFRTDSGLKTVPIGGTAGGWELVAVEHRGVVVRYEGKAARILVGGDQFEGGVTSSTAPAALPASPAGLAPAPPGAAPQSVPSPQPTPTPVKPAKGQPVARGIGPALDGVAIVDQVPTARVALRQSPAAIALPAAIPPPHPGSARPADGEVAMVEQLPVVTLTLGQAPVVLAEPKSAGGVSAGIPAVALDVLPSPDVQAAVSNLHAATVAAAPAAAEPVPAPEQAPVRLSAGAVALDERKPTRAVPSPQPAVALATEPATTPVVAGPALQPPSLAGRPLPVETSGAGAILAGAGKETPPEQAPLRSTDPAALPARGAPDAKTQRGKPKPSVSPTHI